QPKGILGKILLSHMNSGKHKALSSWGLSHLNLKKYLSILDMGCGGGANVATLLRESPNAKVVGADYSDVSVSKSRKINSKAIKRGRCRIQLENVHDLSFKDGEFDLVTAFETVYFWGDLEDAFKRICKALKSGGTFFICNEADGDHIEDYEVVKKISGMKIYKENEITDALTASGFDKVTVKRKSENHWICFIAEKQNS
ncbi:MAG: class I SAM-dependent methyltransferase, partial [Clostridiales bacterium]|nr:class I SAM-dependent methyltransferase [Clostridiales bacterium]